jgi:hypothetical protein
MKERGLMLPPYLADPLDPIHNLLNNIPTGRCTKSKRYDKNNIEIPDGVELPANIIIRVKKTSHSPPPSIMDSSDNEEENIIIVQRGRTITFNDILHAYQIKEKPEEAELIGKNSTDDHSL